MPTPARLATVKPVSIAILAMGGQGGGVLADWIVAVAEAKGWVAQSTSVPGVAQRTGATIYYIEAVPGVEGVHPTLSLMPTPGDVDVVIAAELMEAGRSVLRGIVTPNQTTLITSTHRSYAVSEKEKPGDGIADPNIVVSATDFAAKRTIAFDMEAIAVKNGSVISASLFGAFAASGALPFERADYEAIIRAGGKGIEPSLKAFGAAYDEVLAGGRQDPKAGPDKKLPPPPADAGHPELNALISRLRSRFPEPLQPMIYAGVRRLTDFQDPAYAAEYLDRLEALHARDRQAGGEAQTYAFTLEAAKYLAIAMAYDDVIRVADLKVRGSRFERVKKEVGVRPDQLLYTTEFMHPRMEEVCGTLPRGLGLWIENRKGLYNGLDRFVNRGRRVKTGTVSWFLGLYLVSGMRRFRRRTLRHARELAFTEQWIALALSLLGENYPLAVEVLKCRRLVKGYSGTHVRGTSKFDRVLSAVPLLRGREDGADWMRRLRQAALIDEDGIALDGALKTVASL
jgi:indolepyruvate ferredoxin oxidoreductase beta subunit